MIYNIQRMSTEDGPGLRTTVFLKGCPLRCPWCSNPESQQVAPQLFFFQELCTGCHACENSCPSGAIAFAGGQALQNHSICQGCGSCSKVCSAKARDMSGKLMTVDEVMAIVRKDALFYSNSGGGITFGGGEPTTGGEFFLQLLEVAVNEGYHTTVDTCGYCPEERFDKTVSMTELFLFDCKHMDPAQHKKLTGVDNSLILRNLRVALESNAQVRVRMPLIPHTNDSEENIAAMAAFLGKREVEIMPYHAFGRNKYAALGQIYPSFEDYTPEDLQGVLDFFKKHGLEAVIV